MQRLFFEVMMGQLSRLGMFMGQYRFRMEGMRCVFYQILNLIFIIMFLNMYEIVLVYNNCFRYFVDFNWNVQRFYGQSEIFLGQFQFVRMSGQQMFLRMFGFYVGQLSGVVGFMGIFIFLFFFFQFFMIGQYLFQFFSWIRYFILVIYILSIILYMCK